MGRLISASANNLAQAQTRQKKIRRLNSPVSIEQKVIATITSKSFTEIDVSGVARNLLDKSTDSGVEFSNAEIRQA
jgi:hypothetical protein